MLENMNLNEEKKEPLRLLPLRWRICSLQPCKLIFLNLKRKPAQRYGGYAHPPPDINIGLKSFLGNINISHKY